MKEITRTSQFHFKWQAVQVMAMRLTGGCLVFVLDEMGKRTQKGKEWSSNEN